MKKKLINILPLLLIFVICVNTNTVFASTPEFPDDRGILLYEEKSNTVLYEKKSEKRFYPASTTKIMTALLVLEHYDLKDKITVGNEITLITEDSSTAGLQQREELTVEDLLYGLLVASGNDAAYTLARSVGSKVGGKTEETEAINYFVNMMNDRAKKLGANHTHFVNPNGLPDANHYSTPKDILTITKELLTHDEVKKIVSTKIYITQNNISPHKWVNTNVFLHENWNVFPNGESKGVNEYYRPEVTGIKTGFTDQAGRCVVFSARKGELDLIGLIYHSNYEDIWPEGIKLMDYAANDYKYIDSVKKNAEIDNLVVSNPRDVSSGNVSVITKKDIPLVVKTEDSKNITKTIEFDKHILLVNKDKTVKLKKSIKSDQKIGQVTFSLKGKVLLESDVYSAQDVNKSKFLDSLFQWLILLLSIVLVLLFFRIRSVKKRRQMKRKLKKKIK